jgi:hypothetical protein
MGGYGYARLEHARNHENTKSLRVACDFRMMTRLNSPEVRVRGDHERVTSKPRYRD